MFKACIINQGVQSLKDVVFARQGGSNKSKPSSCIKGSAGSSVLYSRLNVRISDPLLLRF